jgi:hypothetical protein
MLPNCIQSFGTKRWWVRASRLTGGVADKIITAMHNRIKNPAHMKVRAREYVVLLRFRLNFVL